MTADIQKRLEAQPFVPFVVHMADGREYSIPTPDHAHLSPTGRRLHVFADDDSSYILPALMIGGLKVPPNGQKTS
jgi:hypothetical protein